MWITTDAATGRVLNFYDESVYRPRDDGSRHPAIPADATEVPDAATQGLDQDQAFTWDGASLAPYRPAPSLDDRKAARQAEVNAKRDAVIGGGYQHNFGSTAGIRTLDQRGAEDETAWLTVKINAMEAVAAGAGTTPIAIRDAGNETFSVSAAVASAAMTAMAQWRMAVSQHSWSLKDAIEAAADEAAVAAVDIEAGWPGA